MGQLTAASMNGVGVAGDLSRRDNRIDTGQARTRVALHAPKGIGSSREDGGGSRERGNGLHGEGVQRGNAMRLKNVYWAKNANKAFGWSIRWSVGSNHSLQDSFV